MPAFLFSPVILIYSEGSHEILRAKALRMTLLVIHSNDNMFYDFYFTVAISINSSTTFSMD